MAVRNRRLAELVLFAGLATLHTWPLATDPAHLTRLDNDDTTLNTWIIAWVAHQLPRDPLRLFDAPIFYPAPDALAFSEHMVVQAVMGAPLQWAGVSPVLVYNILVWLGLALSGWTMSLLIHRWTGSRAAGIVAGALVAFNAHLLTRFAHLQALHIEFLPIVLYAFDRVLVESRRRDIALLAAAFVAQALCSNYTMVLMSAALLVSAAVRSEAWGAQARRVWTALAIAGAASVLVMLPFLLPYARIRDVGGVRSIDEVRYYSAGLVDYLVTAGNLHYQGWSHRFFEGRTALFPGVTASLLTLVAVATGLAWRDPRARMALAFGIAGFALSFGPGLPGYAWLHEHLPVLQGMRGAARWGFLPIVAVALLASFAVAHLERRFGGRSWWHAAAIGLLGLVTVEALRAPLPLTRFDRISPVHARLADPSVKAIAVFPLYPPDAFNRNAAYMLEQTLHWKPMVNGYSGAAPRSFHEHAAQLQSFPDEAAIGVLRDLGVTHAVLHRTPLERQLGAATVAGLRARRDLAFVLEQDGVIIYRVVSAAVTSRD